MRTSCILVVSLLSASASLNTSGQGLSFDLAGSFTLPGGAFDVLPDGRLIGLNAAGSVLVQTSVNGDGFAVVNQIGPVNGLGFGPSFFSLSPDGTRAAVGNNEFNAGNAVLVYETAALLNLLGSPLPATPSATVITPNFDGEWSDGSTLFVSGADASTFRAEVSRIVFEPGSAPVAETVIAPAGVFSGGVAVSGGRVLVGDGLSGDVVAFELGLLDPAAPLPQVAGELVATANSASAVDALGGLLLVAGQVFNGAGDATVVDLATGEAVSLAPVGADAFYGGYFNEATGQLVVTATDFTTGTAQAFVYNIVPAPGSLLGVAGLGVLASRRRRH